MCELGRPVPPRNDVLGQGCCGGWPSGGCGDALEAADLEGRRVVDKEGVGLEVPVDQPGCVEGAEPM